MSVNIRPLAKTLVGMAIVAIASSALTVIAESKLAPRGSFRVAMTGGNPTVQLPHLATFVPDGGVISSTIPVSCLTPGQTMSEGHGDWSFHMHRGTPTLRFHILADLYTQPTQDGLPETTYDGSVAVDASVPVTSDAVRGLATLTFPDGHPCAKQFNGPVAFVATPVSETKVTPQ